MKNWSTLALVVAGLSLVLYLQFGQHRADEPSENAVVDQPDISQDTAPVTATVDARTTTFGGYPCPRDCSENRGGYAWAAQNNITDPDSCTGHTGAFIEGCRVYAEERTAELPSD